MHTKDSLRALTKLCRTVDGELRIVGNPPLVTPIEDVLPGAEQDHLEDVVRRMIRTYRRTLPRDRRHLLESYRYVHAARKVVGVGSVGARTWILLMVGRDDGDPLFLQFKEAQASVLEPFLGKSQFAQHGQRVVEGQRMMQAASDVMLGWERIVTIDGQQRDFYIRQLWDSKGSAEVELMDPSGLEAYGRVCGWTLARAHARSGDRIAIAALSRAAARPSTAPWRRSPRRTRTRTSGTTAHCRRRWRPAASRPRWASDLRRDEVATSTVCQLNRRSASAENAAAKSASMPSSGSVETKECPRTATSCSPCDEVGQRQEVRDDADRRGRGVEREEDAAEERHGQDDQVRERRRRVLGVDAAADAHAEGDERHAADQDRAARARARCRPGATPNRMRPTVSRITACTSAIMRWKMTRAVANSCSGSGVRRSRRSMPFWRHATSENATPKAALWAIAIASRPGTSRST